MKISDVVKWTGGEPSGNLPAGCAAVTQDTRKISLGALYVALKGSRFDGHSFVSDAFAKGAAAALVEESWKIPPTLSSAPLIRVKNTYEALADLASAWRDTFRPPATHIVGLTGSSGKTTTRAMTAALLAASRKEICQTSGNLNNDIGLPLSLLSMPQGASFGVFETGVNHPGEMDRLAAILRPDAVIVTNIGTAHIEFFGDQAGIAREKGKLLAAIPADGFAVLNTETACFNELAERCTGRVVTVSFQNRDADFVGRIADVLRGIVVVKERATGLETELCSGLPGEHNAADLLPAFATARTLGVSAEACAGALRDFSLPGMRWQVTVRNGITFVNDAYNANPQSMAASIRTFMALPCRGRRILVLGDMFELGSQSEKLHREIGLLVADCKPDLVFFVGNAMAFAAQEAREHGFPASALVRADTADSAAPLLASKIRYSDSVLLKASRGVGLERVLAE
ncbi:MAG: UDP-N-acetylmuramoyl-tripeptide--D-alanyl-D-alanine ligase [Kiritimatiellae bacterium]|nr:UDP-N-acetylmuramoyl-tripeptide--D-alanyl-D-alanine ligase [Kiritimatiellia bacterium]